MKSFSKNSWLHILFEGKLIKNVIHQIKMYIKKESDMVWHMQ